ncbi:cytochrome P450 protein [Rutstroemia sp. NJR-2017a BVV2]|nr:cytochrome P450 protein [Rutstroemia sp. NJR-2017a BVV2]
MLNYYVVLVSLIPLLAWPIYVLCCLGLNYRKARKIGLPLVVLPIDCGNPLWMSVDTTILPFFRRLPFRYNNFIRFSYRGWEIHDRYRAHQEFGDAFIFVTPGKNWVQVCNVETLTDIFARKTEFIRPVEQLEMLNVFGPNLGTTEGHQWQRHRKITATCFNEQNNELVWSESIRQGAGMLQYWSSKPSVKSVAEDTRTLSLHVMSSAGFGKSYPFQGAEEDATADESTSYKYALKMILDNAIPLVALGPDNLNKWWLPKSWKKLHQATITFRNYMTTVYQEEKEALAHGKSRGNNLMTSLVRASQTDTTDMTSTSKGTTTGGGLTEKEIYGNIFVFNFAGHDTTANSLALAVALMATRPDIQDWISDEISVVFGGEDPENSIYSDCYPRLKRCLAVAYETLRLYTPVAISKSTGSEARELKVNENTYVLPPDTIIIPSYSALHTHPRHWGSNSLEWEPSRWITTSSSSSITTMTSDLEPESFLEFPKGKSPFIAWSAGVRVCPGKKFSQVEFVAVLVALFREYRVKPVLLPGEDDEAARKRLQKLVEEDTGMRLLLQMMHPEKAVLKWEKRV